MSSDLLNSVKELFGGDFVSRASNLLGENETSVKKAISAAVPTVIAGFLNNAGLGKSTTLLDEAKSFANSSILNNLGSFLTNSNFLEKGSNLFKDLFGGRQNAAVNMIANFSGIKSSSAASILNVATPAAYGILGSHANETNMSASGLLSYLARQKAALLDALPAGINPISTLGLSGISSIGPDMSDTLSRVTGNVPQLEDQEVKTKARNWLLPLILVLGFIAVLWYLLSGTRTPREEVAIAATTDTVASTPALNTAPVERVSMKVVLPNGKELDAYKGGIEDRLVNFIKDQSKPIDKNTWFDFDDLNFEMGSAKITAESDRQLQNIAAILNAYPQVVVKVGGYTDRTGDSIGNLKLSQARADAVIAALKIKGTNASQLDGAEGYGSQFAQEAASATDEERKKDRRISLSVRAK